MNVMLYVAFTQGQNSLVVLFRGTLERQVMHTPHTALSLKRTILREIEEGQSARRRRTGVPVPVIAYQSVLQGYCCIGIYSPGK